ncbi:hypothetical protein K1719_043206 [Acacia pycnantha]|nr:hypothetical protein K1719_043206 [Acacia pycnantha]
MLFASCLWRSLCCLGDTMHWFSETHPPAAGNHKRASNQGSREMSSSRSSTQRQQRNFSFASVNQPGPGEPLELRRCSRTIFTARKRVIPPGPVLGPCTRSEASSVGDNGQPSVPLGLAYAFNSESRTLSARYTLAPDQDLLDAIKSIYDYAMVRRNTHVARYQHYLESVEALYRDRRILKLYDPDYVWIRIVIYFFPDTYFWNQEKNLTMEEGPDDFGVFIRHIRNLVDRYMWIDELV